MKLVKIGILFAIGNVTLLAAIPTTILVKNDTDQSVVLDVYIKYSLTRGISATTSTLKLSNNIEGKSELNLIDWIVSSESRAGHTLSIQKLVIEINHKEVDLGDYSALKILIFQDGNTTSTRVERLSKLVATRLATAYWWKGVKTSWSSFWQKLFGRKRK